MKGQSMAQSDGFDTFDPSNTDRTQDFVWLKARYKFHSFAYRDPRSAFATAPGLPVVSPTTVLLGIAATLFSLGAAKEAKDFLEIMHRCKVKVDAPEGAIFFRAFHQLRRYETDKDKRDNPRLGLTNIGQGTREYALLQGGLTVFIRVPRAFSELVSLALLNMDHLGTHDSLCSIDGEVEVCGEPEDVVYLEPEEWQKCLPKSKDVTAVTLSTFTRAFSGPTVGEHWWLAGGNNTELKTYLIRGSFSGTTRGKLYRKD